MSSCITDQFSAHPEIGAKILIFFILIFFPSQ